MTKLPQRTQLPKTRHRSWLCRRAHRLVRLPVRALALTRAVPHRLASRAHAARLLRRASRRRAPSTRHALGLQRQLLPILQRDGIPAGAAALVGGVARMRARRCSKLLAVCSVSGWVGPSTRWSDASAARSICSASTCLPWPERDEARLFALASVSGCSAPSTRFRTPSTSRSIRSASACLPCSERCFHPR